MADAYIVGYPPQCTIDGNDVIWPAGEWDRGVFLRQFTTSSLVGNVSQVSGSTVPTATISSVPGEQSDGTFKISLSSVPSGWADGDRLTPLNGTNAYWYATHAGAAAVMADGDTIYTWYADTNKMNYWRDSIGVHAISAFGMLPNQLGVLNADGNIIDTNGLDFAAHLEWENYILITRNTGPISPRLNSCSGAVGSASITARRCRMYTASQNYNAIRPYTSNGTDIFPFTMEWCFCVAPYNIVYNDNGNSGMTIQNCTFDAGAWGVAMLYQEYHRSGYFRNLFALNVAGLINRTGWENELDYLASHAQDLSGYGANCLSQQSLDDLDLVTLPSGFVIPFPRLGGSSSLLGAGKDLSGTHYDLFGNEVTAGNFPIGCSIGIETGDFPAVGDVRQGTIFDMGARTGTLDLPSEEDVKLGVQYGAGGTEYTGTYDPVGSPPAAPGIISAVASSGQVVITVAAADGEDATPIYLRYRLVNGSGEWSAESESLKRTGDGDITVSGLSNYLEYELAVYHKDGNLTSEWSRPVFRTPAPAQETYLRDQAAAALLNAARSPNLPNAMQMTFSNPGDADVVVYGVLDQGRVDLGRMGGTTDTETVRVTIPRQTGFPPTQFRPGATVTIDDIVYELQDLETDMGNVLRSASFTFSAVRYQTVHPEIGT